MSEFWVFEAEFHEKHLEHWEKQLEISENELLKKGQILPFKLNGRVHECEKYWKSKIYKGMKVSIIEN